MTIINLCLVVSTDIYAIRIYSYITIFFIFEYNQIRKKSCTVCKL